MAIDLLVIAGEHSGDNHAAQIVRELKGKYPSLSIYAIGGPALQTAGAHLLFDLTQWSVVGLVESIKHYNQFMQLMHWTVEWIRCYQPKIVCLVDFPGFNLRLAQRLFQEKLSVKGGGTVKVYEYIAPQIWAWKAKRRFKIAKWIDSLGVIFPFEKACFADTSLNVQFVGHPLLKEQNPFWYDSNGKLLLLPGSRNAAVRRIYPLLLEAFHELQKGFPQLQAIVPYPNERIKHLLEKFPKNSVTICPLTSLKEGVCGALMTSGTASFQVALAGIPGVVTYKAHPWTFFIGKHLVKVSYLSMANILLKQELYPECLQDLPYQAATIAQKMSSYLQYPEKARQTFQEGASTIRQALSASSQFNAAKWLEAGIFEEGYSYTQRASNPKFKI